MDSAALDPQRSAVIRGWVLDRDDNPLAGVSVTIKDHPEFGHTLSRLDGAFDLVVNGGGPLVLDYRLAGHLPAQRRIETAWGDYARAEDVVLVPLQGQVTEIDLADTTQAIQVARGHPVADAAGPRQATLLFRAGTQATVRLPDGIAPAATVAPDGQRTGPDGSRVVARAT